MILTEKAKEYFLKYAFKNYGIEYTNLYESIFINTLIIEWFDSVGIYISTTPYFDKQAKYNRGFECYVSSDNSNIVFEIDNDGDVFESRSKAKIKAIIKANEIYNERNQ